MKFGIIGRSKMLYETILQCIKEGHKPTFIITAPAADEYEIQENDFELLANKLAIPYLCTKKLDSSKIKKIDPNKRSNICISVNFYSIIPTSVINFFPLGILNGHAGNLPKYRGNAPIAWAILNEEKKIGLTIHKMEGDKLDSGAVICKSFYDLNKNSRIGEVQNWVNDMLPKLFLEALGKLVKNKNYILEKQNEGSSLRCFPRIPEDGKINWNSSAKEIIKLINASSEPYQGAFCFYKNEKLIIWRAKIYQSEFNYLAIPGQVYITNNKVTVITGKGMIELGEVSLKKKRKVASELIKSIRTRMK